MSAPDAVDDAALLDDWRTLAGTPALVEAAATIDPADVRGVERLRRAWPAPLVRIALQLTVARRKAVARFSNAGALFADPEGVEQATSERVAAHKAARFADAAAQEVIDLCCGIGGDAMSLVRHASVRAVDLRPLRAWMTERNAGCATEVADAESIDVDGSFIHLDPARRHEGSARDAGRRHWRYEDYRPGPATIERLLGRAAAAAVKLGPGVDFGALPVPDTSEVEVISDAGTLVQAVLWTGRLARHPGRRTATRLPDGLAFTAEPDHPMSCSGEPPAGGCVMTVDPAIERAGLLGALASTLPGQLVHPQLGLLAAAEPINSPWLTVYLVDACLSWRKQHVHAWLREHGAGIVTVKTRGRLVDPDILQREWRGDGPTAFTVFVLRADQRRFALVTRRVPGTSG